jgi:TRAP-type mannitol/chloroaromatic compound transport system permease small subunit
MTDTTAASPALDSGFIRLALRIFALSVVGTGLLFVLNNYLIFWQDWPGLSNLFAHQGWFGFEALRKPLSGLSITLGWVQLASYLVLILGIVGFVVTTPQRLLHVEAARLGAIAAYIVRAAFWAVFIVGLGDAIISFLRVEGLLGYFVGADLEKQLGISRIRGAYVHMPLVGLACVIAYFKKTLGFSWLALLVVVAELQIVIARFVFSYEQAFMGDLVRFWYAGLFLFASAYALVEEGHVRVDVMYAGFGPRGKAWVNILGCLLLGAPLCWVIITLGMWSKAAVINSPILSFETTQAGFGMFVKYLMAGFLAVFAVSMLVQFMNYFLANAAELRDEPGRPARPGGLND